MTDWKPPFCANEVPDVPCPACNADEIRVREKETYFDGDSVEAYCANCHANLELMVSVDVAFACPEVV